MGLVKIEYSQWKCFVCLLFLANITINGFVSKKIGKRYNRIQNIKDVEIKKDQIGYKAKDILVMKDVNKIVVIQFF